MVKLKVQGNAENGLFTKPSSLLGCLLWTTGKQPSPEKVYLNGKLLDAEEAKVVKNIDVIGEFGGDASFWKSFADGIEALRVEEGRIELTLKE